MVNLYILYTVIMIAIADAFFQYDQHNNIHRFECHYSNKLDDIMKLYDYTMFLNTNQTINTKILNEGMDMHIIEDIVQNMKKMQNIAINKSKYEFLEILENPHISVSKKIDEIRENPFLSDLSRSNNIKPVSFTSGGLFDKWYSDEWILLDESK